MLELENTGFRVFVVIQFDDDSLRCYSVYTDSASFVLETRTCSCGGCSYSGWLHVFKIVPCWLLLCRLWQQ